MRILLLLLISLNCFSQQKDISFGKMDGTIYTSTVPYIPVKIPTPKEKWHKPFITDNDGWVYALQFNAGLWEGFHDALKYHYWTVKHTFWMWDIELNDKFWRDSLSWKNKYRDWPTDKRERFPGSKSVLVWATDGEHLTRMISNTSTVISVGISASDFKDYPKGQWLPLALKRIILSAIANKVGFLITYNIIFKP